MSGRLLHLELHYPIKAPREAIYKILTDFENMPRYFPAVAKSSRVVARNGLNVIVEAQTKAFLGSRTFNVRLEGQLRPPEGFSSTNTSSLGIEREVFAMEDTGEGTIIHYTNDVEIKSLFFRLFGSFLIKKVAVRYWKRNVFDKLKLMVEE